MAKILISFLGTGRINKEGKSKREYEKAKYEIDGQLYEETFVTKALDTHYNIDKVFYIGTLKSMWEEVYRSYRDVENLDEDVYFQLADEIDSFDERSDVENNNQMIKDVFKSQDKILPIIIKYGLDKNELNYNIAEIIKIEEAINNGDEIYLDITHGFRSLPLIVMNVLNYLSDVSIKNFTIKGISYGMFEAKKDDITPVVDLDIVTELHENIKAAHEFNHYGNAYLFSDLVSENCKSMSKILKEFSDSKSLNHIYDLKNKINQFNSFKKEYENLSPIQKITIPKTIDNFVKRFNQNDSDSKFQYQLANWMFDNKQYGFASIVIIECLVTKVCELNRLDSSNKSHRDLSKNIIVLAGRSKDKQSKGVLQLKNRDFIKEEEISLLKTALDNPVYQNFQSVWGQANSIRKSVSHAIENKQKVNSMIKSLKSQLDEVFSLIETKM